MARRVAIGNFGGNFLFRVSKAGIDAVSGALGNMILHEGMQPIVPLEQGTVTVPPNSDQYSFVQRTLTGAYTYRPTVILRSANNWTPSALTYMARIHGDSGASFKYLRIYNFTPSTLTIQYKVFREVIPT